MAVIFIGWHSEDRANVGRRAVPINASVCLLVLGILSLTCLYGQTVTDLLVQADRLAEQSNWSKARPIYAVAEAEFQRLGDRRSYTRNSVASTATFRTALTGRRAKRSPVPSPIRMSRMIHN